MILSFWFSMDALSDISSNSQSLQQPVTQCECQPSVLAMQ